MGSILSIYACMRISLEIGFLVMVRYAHTKSQSSICVCPLGTEWLLVSSSWLEDY